MYTGHNDRDFNFKMVYVGSTQLLLKPEPRGRGYAVSVVDLRSQEYNTAPAQDDETCL